MESSVSYLTIVLSAIGSLIVAVIGTSVTIWLTNKNRKKLYKKQLYSELGFHLYPLSLNYLWLLIDRGKLTTDILQKYIPLKRYMDEKEAAIFEYISGKIEEIGIEKLIRDLTYVDSFEKGVRNRAPKPVHIISLESKPEQIGWLNEEEAKKAYKILWQLKILNGNIEDNTFYLRKSFDPEAMEVNEELINQNIKNSSKAIIEGLPDLIDEVVAFIDTLNS